MKRTKVNKFYEIIGKATVYASIYALSVVGMFKLSIYILDNCITTI